MAVDVNSFSESRCRQTSFNEMKLVTEEISSPFAELQTLTEETLVSHSSNAIENVSRSNDELGVIILNDALS